ncbi:Acylamidase [Corynebacterium kalinowskii]|uniref:amidase n=1 Tax=Corynebacterium kalinowskii TaxID=2675216 RepID=A0A6B8VUY9_9CORY|nr:amidase [Corynebacterium kalinowskii]QGU01100.1 Acylamidase [Corynebacterium kalinowskii]
MFEEFLSRVSALTPAESGFVHVTDTLPPLIDGPLNGLLLPIKDLMPVSGMPTAYGSITRQVVEPSDPFVLSLVARGARIVGKTATSELGMTAYTEPVGMPAVDNPVWPGHTPGGSSGGAAVAVARDLVRIAHASDGGGSIRVPAAACGVVGFKPPHNNAGGKLTAQGFITKTVADQAMMHAVPLQARPLRVGVLFEPLHGDGTVAPEWLNACVEAANALSDLGHDVVDVSPAYDQTYFQAFETMLSGMCRKIEGEASPIVEWLRSEGQALTAGEQGMAVEKCMSLGDVVRRAWDIDILLTPTLAFDPPKIGHFSALPPREDFDEQTRWTPWCTLFNITGWAGISIPFGGRSIHLGAIRASVPELLALAEELHGS